MPPVLSSGSVISPGNPSRDHDRRIQLDPELGPERSVIRDVVSGVSEKRRRALRVPQLPEDDVVEVEGADALIELLGLAEEEGHLVVVLVATEAGAADLGWVLR